MKKNIAVISLLLLIVPFLLCAETKKTKEEKRLISETTVVDKKGALHLPLDFDQKYPLLADSMAREKRLAWFKKANLGVYLDFGLYTRIGHEFEGRFVMDSEWMECLGQVQPALYEAQAANFDLPNFDIEKIIKWVESFNANYVVLNAKHHDGFCMFDSSYTQYDIADAPQKKNLDFYSQLIPRLRAKGIKIGFHYSILDWHHPSQASFDAGGEKMIVDLDSKVTEQGKAEYIQYMKNQLNELIVKYQADMIWFDGEWVSWWSSKEGWELQEYILRLNPNVIVNSRIGKQTIFDGDFSSFDRYNPLFIKDAARPWEVLFQVDVRYGYQGVERLVDYKILIERYLDAACRGGNLLLKFSLTNEGSLTEKEVAYPHQMNKWLGNALPLLAGGIEPAPVQFWPTGLLGKIFDSWRRFFLKDGKLYMISLYAPMAAFIPVPEMPDTVYTKAYFLDAPDKPLVIRNQGKVLKKRAKLFERQKDLGKSTSAKKRKALDGEGVLFDSAKEIEMFRLTPHSDFRKEDYENVEFHFDLWPMGNMKESKIVVFEYEPITQEEVLEKYRSIRK